MSCQEKSATGLSSAKLLCANLAKLVGAADELGLGPLGRVGRKEDLAERLAENLGAAGEIEGLKHVQPALIEPHVAIRVEINQPRVEGAMVCG